jgi:hypothetical protein
MTLGPVELAVLEIMADAGGISPVEMMHRIVLHGRIRQLESENDELRAECTRLYGECNELEPVEE